VGGVSKERDHMRLRHVGAVFAGRLGGGKAPAFGLRVKNERQGTTGREPARLARTRQRSCPPHVGQVGSTLLRSTIFWFNTSNGGTPRVS